MAAAHRPIVVVPYSSSWPEEFRVIAVALRYTFGDLALRIDHIGSTAVAGLAAKDIIDIQITVASLTPEHPIVERIASAGYSQRDDITQDHKPPGELGAADQWAKLYFDAPIQQRATHIHVRAAGWANQRYAILFRDYLRAHVDAAAAYAEVKRQLANVSLDDQSLYYVIKDPVCDILMAGANRWAATVGWTPGPSDA
jgi:GrpB-like predicted nucleotidyltransferase (UPF0157 family)